MSSRQATDAQQTFSASLDAVVEASQDTLRQLQLIRDQSIALSRAPRNTPAEYHALIDLVCQQSEAICSLAQQIAATRQLASSGVQLCVQLHKDHLDGH